MDDDLLSAFAGFRKKMVVISCQTPEECLALAEMDRKPGDETALRRMKNLVASLERKNLVASLERNGEGEYGFRYWVDGTGRPNREGWDVIGYYRDRGFQIIRFRDLSSSRSHEESLPDVSGLLGGV